MTVPMYSSSFRDVSILFIILVNCALFTNFYAYFSLEIDCKFLRAARATL
jgi:hypothetical protein